MSSKVYVGTQAKNMQVAPQFDGYSKVIVYTSDDQKHWYEAGNDAGRTLELYNPFATQQVCDDIYAHIRGFEYQPLSAECVEADPAAELGDPVTVGTTYSGIYSRKMRFGAVATSDISAPHEEEIDHEIPYKSQTERKITREFNNVRTEFSVADGEIRAEVSKTFEDLNTTLETKFKQTSDAIEAKVSQTGGNDAGSFSWRMLKNGMTWYSNNKEVFRLDANGAKVTGEIRATSGVIGGFTIKSNYLSYNNQTWGGTNSNGIYIGTNGIQLGRNFKVDSAGNLTAASGTFTGSVYAGNIQYGGGYGTLNGAGISDKSIYGSQIGDYAITGGKISGSTISSGKLDYDLNTTLANAEYAYNRCAGYSVFDFVNTKAMYSSGDATFTDGKVYVGGYKFSVKTLTVQTPSGNKFIRYLGNA